MIDAVTATARTLHWPQSRVSVEPFGAADDGPRAPFRVTLAAPPGVRLDLGATSTSRPGRTLLEALERAGLNVPSMCRQGVCGECRTSVAGGRVDHRDLVLSAEEKASGQWMMPCVSRAADGELELRL